LASITLKKFVKEHWSEDAQDDDDEEESKPADQSGSQRINRLSFRLYWRFNGNTVADDHRSSATVLPLNLQYNLLIIQF
jgi:hypothetical protein